MISLYFSSHLWHGQWIQLISVMVGDRWLYWLVDDWELKTLCGWTSFVDINSAQALFRHKAQQNDRLSYDSRICSLRRNNQGTDLALISP